MKKLKKGMTPTCKREKVDVEMQTDEAEVASELLRERNHKALITMAQSVTKTTRLQMKENKKLQASTPASAVIGECDPSDVAADRRCEVRETQSQCDAETFGV